MTGGALAVEPLRDAVAGVRMPGRLEMFPGRPDVLLDGAHNPAGMEAMVASLPAELAGRRPVAVVSVLGDKDAAAMVGALRGVVSEVIATRSSHARAVPSQELAARAREAGIPARAIEDPAAALAAARELAGAGGAVLVAGSLYLLADLRPQIAAGSGETPARVPRARKGIDPTEAK